MCIADRKADESIKLQHKGRNQNENDMAQEIDVFGGRNGLYRNFWIGEC